MLRVSDRVEPIHGLRLSSCLVLLSASLNSVSVPDLSISRFNGWPAGFPCQRFASHLAMRVRMTRGQGDSPFLPRIGLPPNTTRQFVLALSVQLSFSQLARPAHFADRTWQAGPA